MTPNERLLLLLVADALLGPGDVAVAEPTRTMIRNARRALDDEAYHMAAPQSAPQAKAGNGLIGPTSPLVGGLGDAV